MIRRVLAALLIPAVAFLIAARIDVRADDPAKPGKPSADKDNAVIDQERLAAQFNDFKSALLRVAQRLERSTRPEDRERAVTLKNAIKEASGRATENKFETLINLLKTSKIVSVQEAKDAMDQTQMLADDIRAILDILLSDDAASRLRLERERVEKLLKFLDKNIRDEKVARANTEAGRLPNKALSKSQQKVTADTKALARAMTGKTEPKPGEGKAKDGKGDGKPGKGQGQPKSGEPKEGQNKPSQSQKDLPPPQETPGRQQIQEAIPNQDQADKNIQQDKKKDASEDQDKAIEKLEQARKALEEYLRQLREEELQKLLADLEARCRRMLAMQKEVYDGTMRLERTIAENPDKRPDRQNEQRSLALSDREAQIIKEVDICLRLLEQDGSGVAFPEVFSQIRDDMVNVVRRLAKVDVGQVTQGIEQDIIKTLEEMIEALKKAQSDKSGKSKPGSKPGNKSLLDLLAELKMIRSMQIRVNTRTVTYARQYPGEQANDSDIQKELVNLADRQHKIYQVTSDIAKGKREQ